MTHHPHVHMIVPGGGFSMMASADRVSPTFFLPVRVLSRLFRRLFLQMLAAATRPTARVLRRPRRARRDFSILRLPRAAAQRRNGWSMPRNHFGRAQPVLAYLSRSPIASPSPIAG